MDSATRIMAAAPMLRPGLCVFAPALRGLLGSTSEAWSTVWHIDAELAGVLLLCALVLLYGARAGRGRAFRWWRVGGYLFAAGGLLSAALTVASLIAQGPLYCDGAPGMPPPTSAQLHTLRLFDSLTVLTYVMIGVAVLLLAGLGASLLVTGAARMTRRPRSAIR